MGFSFPAPCQPLCPCWLTLTWLRPLQVFFQTLLSSFSEFCQVTEDLLKAAVSEHNLE